MSDETGILGAKIDSLYAARQARLELSRKVDAMKGEETRIRGEILDILDNVGLAKASGYMATAGVTFSIEPVVEDWDQVYQYITTQNRFDLLQRRISAPAWRELHESGVLVPGTYKNDVRDLSLTKSTRG
jgi:hypothetical protein